MVNINWYLRKFWNNDFIYPRLHFRSRTPQPDNGNVISSDDENITEYDEDGNIIPIVPITSFKDFDDPNGLENGQETDFASFQSHQEELFEMQRKQLERLKNEENASTNLCNSEHSLKLISCISPASSMPSVSVPSSSSSASPLFSTLDSASVEFAVSAVFSVDVSNRANCEYESAASSTNIDCKLVARNVSEISRNGPFENDLRKAKDISRPSLFDAQKNHNQEPSSLSSPSLCKLKIQNGSQNDISMKTNLPPTDVT